MLKFIVINDTRRELNHVGCTTVMACIEKKCENIILSVSYPRLQEDCFKEKLKMCDCILVNGEGSLHHDQGIAIDIFRLCLLAKKAKKKIFLINSVWEGNIVLDEQANIFDKVYVRESFSQLKLKNIGVKSSVVADLSFYHELADRELMKRYYNRIYIDSWYDDVSIFLAEKSYKEKAPFFKMADLKNKTKKTVIRKIINKLFPVKNTPSLTYSSFDVLSNRGVCITGRFHGATLAISSGFPIVAIGSNTHKVQGLLYDVFGDTWMEMYISPDILNEDILEKKIRYVEDNYISIKQKLDEYTAKAKSDIEHMFYDIVNCE